MSVPRGALQIYKWSKCRKYPTEVQAGLMWTDCELYGCDLEGEGLGMFLRLVGGRYPFKGEIKEYHGRISSISSEGYDF